MSVRHAYTSLKADPTDPTIIGASKWNDAHFYVDAAGAPIGNLGALLYSGAAGAITQIDSVAVGQVLASAGAGVVPAWSASPSLTAITVSGTVTAGAVVVAGVTLDATELGYLDGLTPGTVTASKAVVVDANKDIASFGNLTASTVRGGDGTLAAPAFSFLNDTNSGRFLPFGGAGGVMEDVIDGVGQLRISANSIQLAASVSLGWVNNAFPSATAVDLVLRREGADALAMRRDTNAQAFAIGPNAGGLQLVGATTSSAVRSYGNIPLIFGSNSASNWAIDTAGAFVAYADNAYDIGQSAAGRPRHVYVAQNLAAATVTSGLLQSAGQPLVLRADVGRDLVFRINDTDVWSIRASGAAGHLHAGIDNAFAIGASGANRPSLVYVAQAVVVGTNPATTGAIRLPFGYAISARNNANTADHTLITTGSSDRLYVGQSTAITAIVLCHNGANQYVIPANTNTTHLGYSNTQWGDVYSAAYTSANLTGTLVTNDPQTVANTAIIGLGVAANGYVVIVTDESGVGFFAFRPGSVVIVNDPGGIFTTVKDTADRYNVYWDGALGFRLQNMRAAQGFRVVRLGI